jgi:hypothetical protein
MAQPTSPKPSPSPESPASAGTPKAVSPSKPAAGGGKGGGGGPKPRDDRPSSHFLRDFSIVLVLSVSGLGYYYHHVQIEKQVNHVAKKAKDLIEKDTPQDFYEAEKHLKEALALDSNNTYCLSALGEINALLWGEDGVADRRGEAEDYTHKADALDPHVAERYSADALILLYAGQAAPA